MATTNDTPLTDDERVAEFRERLARLCRAHGLALRIELDATDVDGFGSLVAYVADTDVDLGDVETPVP